MWEGRKRAKTDLKEVGREKESKYRSKRGGKEEKETRQI
jgi:hypothetical protein